MITSVDNSNLIHIDFYILYTFHSEHVNKKMGCFCCKNQMLARQRETFAFAVDCSKRTGKPILIIGDPNNGCLNRYVQTYGPTSKDDRILDLNPSNNSYEPYNLNLTYLKEFKDNSYVIFESKTFNLCDNIPLLLHEALRVSGGDLFCTGSNTCTCWIKCGRHLYNWYTREGLPRYSLKSYLPGNDAFYLHCYDSNTIIAIKTSSSYFPCSCFDLIACAKAACWNSKVVLTLPQVKIMIMTCTSFWYQFLVQVFGTSFWYRFLVPVSGTSFWYRFLVPVSGTWVYLKTTQFF